MEILFYIISGIIILFILGIILLKLFGRPVNRSNEFVLNNLKKIVDEKDYDDEFDDFLSVPISNQRFEEMRKYCVNVSEKGIYSNYSVDEKDTIKKFIYKLEPTN